MGKRMMGLLICATALMAVPVQAEFWAISDLDLVLDKNTDASPPQYWLKGFTFPDHDIALEDLVVGESTGVVNVDDEAGRRDITLADNLELNDFAPRNGANPPEITTINFGGSPTWQDTNGADKFDFFIFEAGGNDEFTVQAVLPGGVLGQKVVVPASKWKDLGPEPRPDINRTPGPNNNQPIHGIAWKITDLLDADGNALANDTVIEGLVFTSPGMDPSCICAVRGTPFASAPDPANGATISKICPVLMWVQGMGAASEEVYFSASMAEVENLDATALLATASQGHAAVCVPGGPYADGLAPGTYYWRIVTTTTAQETMPGPIWSFHLIGATAFDPAPVEGALFVDPDADLSWSAGAEALFHNVFIGTDFDTVANATEGAIPTVEPTYDPGTLQAGTTYYWRVDEFDGVNTAKGDVWSFTTAPAGEGGLKADYFTGEFYLFGDPVASRVDAQIDFDWGQVAPDPAVDREQFSARWKGEIQIPADGVYTFIIRSNDGSRIYVNNELVAEDWSSHTARDSAGTIDLEAGQYPIAVEYYQNGGGAEIEVLWQSDLITRQTLPSAVLVPVVRARLIYPAMEAVNISQSPRLRWETAAPDATHRVFLGEDAAAVDAADTGTTGIYKGEQEASTYLAQGLEPGKTYYWRVDEVIPGDPQSPVKGHLWSFTVAEFIVVDDFENYTDETPDRIYEVWADGYEIDENGSQVGNDEAPFAEQEVVHSGKQALNMRYDNSTAASSNAKRTFTVAQNWTANEVEALAVWFKGQAPVGAFSYDADKEKYTVTGSGNGVDGVSDGFRFVYKTLTGNGTVTALIESIERPSDWATASVMIRETLEPGSVMATCGFRSTGQGFLRWRTFAGSDLSGTSEEPPFPATFVLPHWFRLTRQGNQFTAEHSSDGTTWEPIGDTVMVTMGQSVYVGLAVSSDTADADRITNTAVFSNVAVAGTVDAAGPFENVKDIGQAGNGPENFYVTVESGAASATINHPDGPEAIVTNDWTRWLIDLEDIAAQGVNLNAVSAMTIGLGNPAGGGDGILYVDDIRLLDAAFLPSGLTVAPLDSAEITGDDGMVLAINGIDANDLIVGTTTTDFEDFGDHPATDADDLDLSTYASLDDSSYIKMLFAIPVSMVFIIERGANDQGFIQPLDAEGNPAGGMVSFAKSDWFKPGLKVSGQNAGGIAITAETPIYGIQILPPTDGNIGLDPASVSGVPAE